MVGSFMCLCLHLEAQFGALKETHQPQKDPSEEATVSTLSLDEVIGDSFTFDEEEPEYEYEADRETAEESTKDSA